MEELFLLPRKHTNIPERVTDLVFQKYVFEHYDQGPDFDDLKIF
jgi:uncharacterized protein Usg